MIEKIKEVGTLGDSIGGTTETIIYNLEAGLGNPIYENIESKTHPIGPQTSHDPQKRWGGRVTIDGSKGMGESVV